MSSLQRFGFPLLLVLICLSVMAQKVDITQTDLGRHLKNGDVVLNGTPEQREAVLHTNYYSYTAPNEPIVNHHWLSGVVFYKIWQAVGFTGLAILYSGMIAISLLITYFGAARSTDSLTAAALTIPIAPLIAWRAEPRPEGFTYLFLAIFFALLNEWFVGRLRPLWLWLLPPMMCMWINLHVAFIFGFFVLGVFGLKVLLADGIGAIKGRLGLMVVITAACGAATLLNPSGLNGVLYPFTIFGKIEFKVTELQSFATAFADNRWKWPHTWYIVCLIAAIGLFVRFVRRPFDARKFPWPEALVVAVFVYFGISQLRNIPFTLLALVPTLAAVIGPQAKATAGNPVSRYLTIGAIASGFLAALGLSPVVRSHGGFGVPAEIDASTSFIRANAIHQPIFNDFDIGGFLILNLFDGTDKGRVYSDGRPEAYPRGFLTERYEKALNEESVWHEEDRRYHFNAIVLSLADGQLEKFILRRVRDDEWAPVFADNYALIFVRRTPENAVLIANHEIPRNRFR